MLCDLGDAEIIVNTSNLDHSGGYAAGLALVAKKSRPDGIFCVNDLTAIGVIDALRIEARLSAPGEVRIIGYDNIGAVAWPAHELTTFDQRIDDMVGRAVALIDRSADRGPAKDTIPYALIERRSA